MTLSQTVEYSWNMMAHGDAQGGKWRGNWRMEWVASTLHTTSEHGVSSITTADAHTSAASSRLNWRPRWFKWTRPFRRKTKSDFCARAITFQMQSTTEQHLTTVIWLQTLQIWGQEGGHQLADSRGVWPSDRTFPRFLVYSSDPPGTFRDSGLS